MKSVIPFSKELDFSGKLSEITSISLEREFEVLEGVIEGNLFVTGDYKSHEVSANVIPFSFKIPFSIEIPEETEKETITLEISDFAYDILDDSKIKVNIELELSGEMKTEEKIEEETEIKEVEVDTEEILRMMEEIDPEEENDTMREESEIEIEEEKEMEEVKEEKEMIEEREMPMVDNMIVEETQIEDALESEELILENVTNKEEYATYHIHIVKEGENIETICTMYNSNLSLLTEYNNIENITSGEKIIIPYNDEQ